MDKTAIRQTMLKLESDALAHAREDYLEFLESARLDRSEPIEHDEQAQAVAAGELAEAFDQPVLTHAHKLEHIERVDFSPKSAVEEGAVVKVGGRHFVVAVSTTRFTCDGVELMGISTEAPIYKAMEGKKAGETYTFRGKTMTVEEVL